MQTKTLAATTHRGLEREASRSSVSRNLIYVRVLLLLFVACSISSITYAQTTGSAINAVTPGNGLDYHGGFLITPMHVYYIFYGNWDGVHDTPILDDLITGLNGSSYLNILNTYGGKVAPPGGGPANESLNNHVTLNGAVFDPYSHGSTIDDTAVKDIVTRALNTLGTDPYGVYFVLTSPDVISTRGSDRFCGTRPTDYCGYHSHTFRNNNDIKYAFVGNASSQCPNTCIAQSTGPNGNAGVDGMANVIVHELAEAVTDPDLDAWNVPDPQNHNNKIEIGDKCNFKFGSLFVAPNGALANVTLGSRNYLLQQLWVNAGGGFCDISYSTLASVLQFGAQNPAVGHVIGHATNDGGWSVPFPGSQNWLSYGPYTTILGAGDYVAVWNLSSTNNTSNLAMANIDVNDATTQTEIATRQPLLNEFTSIDPFTYQVMALPFSLDSSRAGHQFEFRVFWFDTATIGERALGYVPMQWNAQDPALGHIIGTADFNTGFPGWSASVGDGANWLQYGPYTTLSQTGNYLALWTLQIDFNYNNGVNEVVAIVDVNDATTQTRIGSLQIHRQDFNVNNVDQVFEVPFLVNPSIAGHQFEFRIWWNNFAYIREQAVGVVKVP
jgi:hypothetical protein